MQPSSRDMPGNTVAVIGAGPSGIITAAWLSRYGFEPVLFEASDSLGGQWNGNGQASATWAGMRTNTSRVMSAFSDLDHAAGTAVYPRREEMLAYLERYAQAFDLPRRIRFGTRLERLEQTGDGRWRVCSASRQMETEEIFRQVIIATGPQASPVVPALPGLVGFSGALGVAHTAQYDGAERYRGRSVLVAGCSISALEIASELALAGARNVISTYRRQRYILPKLIAGIPTDHVMFNRAAALAAGVTPPDDLAEHLKALVLKASGSPEQFGAAVPNQNIFAAGLSQSQHFLPSVAEGRIDVRPWIDRIEGRVVRFSDGSHCEPDAILFGTGYRLSMPWLPSATRTAANLDAQGIDLFDHTFHPDLQGLAFVGLYNLVGPSFPVLELQARWITYCLAGLVQMPSREMMASGLATGRATREQGAPVLMHELALAFARHIGAEPELRRWPDLERALLFGPLSPVSFRLQGPDSLQDAPERAKAAAEAFGAMRGFQFTPEEAGLRDLLQASLHSRAA